MAVGARRRRARAWSSRATILAVAVLAPVSRRARRPSPSAIAVPARRAVVVPVVTTRRRRTRALVFATSRRRRSGARVAAPARSAVVVVVRRRSMPLRAPSLVTIPAVLPLVLQPPLLLLPLLAFPLLPLPLVLLPVSPAPSFRPLLPLSALHHRFDCRLLLLFDCEEGVFTDLGGRVAGGVGVLK